MLDLLKRTMTVTLDVDWLWRRLGRKVVVGLNDSAGRAWARLTAGIDSVARWLNGRLHRHHGPEGVFGRWWPTGTMAFWTTVMLGAVLILSYA
jgi:multicomponent Na+:H+ antiporter subunit D